MTRSPAQPSPKPRGAPLGNRNALKHGFYSRQYRPYELEDLNQHSFIGLNDEISMLRVCIRRMMSLFENAYEPQEAIQLMRLVCLAAASLTRMIRAQAIAVPSPGDPVQATFLQAVAEYHAGQAEETAVEAAGAPSPQPSPPRPVEAGNTPP